MNTEQKHFDDTSICTIMFYPLLAFGERFLHNLIKLKIPVHPLASQASGNGLSHPHGQGQTQLDFNRHQLRLFGLFASDGFDKDHTFSPGATRLPHFFTEEPLPSHIISTRVDTVGTTHIRPFSPANGRYPSAEPFVGFPKAHRASGLRTPHNHQYAFQSSA